MVTNIVEDTDL